jgi:hypothetical protein
MPALVPGVVDVALSPLNQVPPDTSGPLGRLQHLIDCQIHRYEPHYTGTTGVVPAKVKVEPRDAFVSLSTSARSIVDGTVTTPTWSNAELLNSLGTQLVSVADAIPRVYNGSTWSTYPNTRTLTQKLSQEIFHTSQHTIQAPTSAVLSGVTCSVWTESVETSAGVVTSSFIGFRASNTAWLVAPAVLAGPSAAGDVYMAKVVTDGSFFFAFFNDDTVVHVAVYDTNGAQLGQTSGGTNIGLHTGVPGIWDITPAVTASPNTGTVVFAQALSTSTDSGTTLISVGWSGSAVTVHSALDSGMHCTGPLGFITNKVNGLTYLGTGKKSGTSLTLWTYEVTNLAHTHEYSVGGSINLNTQTVDTITGAVDAGLNVNMSVGLLPSAATPATEGPPLDPAYRYLITVNVQRGGGSSLVRTTQNLVQVSRAFEVDGEYYVYAYLQSGSGIGLTPTSLAVTLTSGDYMIGAAQQSVTVQPGDQLTGSPVNGVNVATVGNTVNVSPGEAARGMTAGDKAVGYTSTGNSSFGIPDGTPLLLWTIANLGAGGAQWAGSRLTLSGASGLNTTFDIVTGAGSTISTPAYDIFGNPITGTTFGSGGTFTVTSMTAYYLADLSPTISANNLAQYYTNSGSTIAVTDSTTSGNSGTFSIKRISTSAAASPSVAGNPTYLFGLRTGTFVWVQTTTQSTHADTFTAVITPANANTFYFAAERFDSTYVGADLVVTADPSVAVNVGTYAISGAGSPPSPIRVTTGAATTLLPQVFEFPFPTISIQLTTQVAYTFKLQSVTPDYTYQGAIVAVQNATNAVNNDTYEIVQINSDGSFIATPTDGSSDQVNEAFFPSDQTVTIYFKQNIHPESQPTWFMVPIAGTQPVVGRFEYGLAYADWRSEVSSTPNLYPFALSDVVETSVGSQVVLPYRAQNVTSSVVEVTAAGEVDIGDSTFASTVGLKAFTLATQTGLSYANSSELLIPGPMATTFTSSGFLEDNINLAPEVPFLVSQSVATSGQLGLQLGGIYLYQVVFEFTDENGNRIYSVPSGALQVSMSGTNNVATIGGRLLFPLGTGGLPIANTYGPTTRQVTISIYRTAFLNGEPTKQHFKITTDLNPNGLAPISSLSSTGFSFPDSFTWNYVDQNPDSDLSANEVLYTDKSFLPRFPAPAFTTGVGSWKNREWVIGYDGAVWMSGEKDEGDAIWFNPAFRYVFPSEDRPLALAPLEDFLVVFCTRSVWYIPAGQFPDATGSNGALTTPVQLPFQNGSTNGIALTIREGAVYDSTAGGLWMITRNLDNVWLSHPVQDTLSGTITGLALDSSQRLFVQQSETNTVCVYDGIPGAWYEWNAPTNGVLMASYLGEACYQDTATVNVVTPGTVADSVDGTTYGIAPDITLAPLSLGNVRGLKRVWEFQAVGDYLGPHNLNVVLSYPEDDQPDTTYDPFTPSADEPYVYPFNPLQEEASLFGIRLYADFTGITNPGASFALEMISAQVGMDPVGLNKRPAAVRLIARS